MNITSHVASIQLTNIHDIHFNKLSSTMYVEAAWSTSRLDPRNCWRQLSYAIKNQRRASKNPLGLCVPKPLVGGFGCPNL